MIERIGIDVVEVARIKRAMQNPRFVNRILTAMERENLPPLTNSRIAGRWAAKEAIAKAVSTKLTWQEVEILNDADGQPCASICSPYFNPETHRILISISHEKGIAAAVAVLERLC